MVFLVWSVLSIIIYINSINAQTQCHTAGSCTSQSLSESTTTCCSENIECYGSNSCERATITVSDYSRLYCFGSFSCYETTISRTSTSSIWSNIECYGLFSCASSTVTVDYGGIYCYGEGSCANSIIDLTTSNTGGGCYGTLSCLNADITAVSSFQFYSSGAFKGGILRATASSVNIVFQGGYAGYDATVICSSSCNIYCYSSSCIGLNITCQGGDDDSCNIGTNCDESLQSDLCPSGFELPNGLQLPNIYNENSNIAFSTNSNSREACYTPTTNALHCDNYQDDQCYNEGALSRDNPVCCTGSESCVLSTSITTNGNASDPNVDNTAFRADGYRSADDISGTISAINGGNIYFSGRQSAIDGSYPTNVEGNGENDVFMTAQNSFQNYKTVNNVKNIYCLSQNSCYRDTFTNIGSSLYVYSTSAFYYGSVSNVGDSVYCDGGYTCQYITTNGVNNNVISVGAYAMRYATHTNIGGTLLAYGRYGLERSTITNAVNIIVDGEYSLSESTIRQVSSLDVTGDDALNEALIISEVQQGNVLIVNIDGDNSEVFTMYCNTTDTCKVRCKTRDACTNLHLHCMGTCYTDCKEDRGIECPIIYGSTSAWTTDPPTNMPTSPTVEPSLIPSNYPSKIPTVEPSSMPTFLPSTDPTNMPTDGPTYEPTAQPTDEPTKGPTNRPTELPTAEPTDQPTDEPTSQPTDEPTKGPTKTPTEKPTLQPTDEPTDNPTINDGSPDDGSAIIRKDNSNPISDIVIIAIVLGIVVLCVAGFLLIYIYARQRKKDKTKRELELKKIELLAANGIQENSRIGSTGNILNMPKLGTLGTMSSVGTLAHMDTLGTGMAIRSATGTPRDGFGGGNINGSGSIHGNIFPDIPNALLRKGSNDSLYETNEIAAQGNKSFKNIDIINDIEGIGGAGGGAGGGGALGIAGAAGGGGLAMGGHGQHPIMPNLPAQPEVGDMVQHMQETNGPIVLGEDNDSDHNNNNNNDDVLDDDRDGSVAVVTGAVAANEAKKAISKGNGKSVILDENNWMNWTQREVLIWLKQNFIQNGLDKDMIKPFLYEFNKKFINGQILAQLKNNANLIDGLKSEFSQKNQQFGIWMVFKTSILSIGDGPKRRYFE